MFPFVLIALGIGGIWWYRNRQSTSSSTSTSSTPLSPGDSLPANQPPPRTQANNTQYQSGTYQGYSWALYGTPGSSPYWGWSVHELNGPGEHYGTANDYAVAKSQLSSWLTSFAGQ